MEATERLPLVWASGMRRTIEASKQKQTKLRSCVVIAQSRWLAILLSSGNIYGKAHLRNYTFILQVLPALLRGIKQGWALGTKTRYQTLKDELHNKKHSKMLNHYV